MLTFDAEDSRERNTLGSWLRESRRRAGMSQKDLASALSQYGVTLSFGALSKWETGEHMPTPYQLCALSLALGGEDPFSAMMPDSSSRALNEEGRRKVAEYIDDLRASGRYRHVRTVEMKVFSRPASAGTGQPLEDDAFDLVRVPAADVPEGADFGIRVRGDSMEPRFTDGQLVWVTRQETLREGETGVFVLDGEAFLKELRYEAGSPGETPMPVLASLNPAYAPRRVGAESRLQVVGRVLD